MNKAELDNELKKTFLTLLEKSLTEEGNNFEVLRVPLSEDSVSAGYQLAIPTLDSERNEKTIIIMVKVPRGQRGGEGYDPYEENERYLANVEEQKEKEKKREEKKKKLEEEREKKRQNKLATRKQMKQLQEELKGGIPVAKD